MSLELLDIHTHHTDGGPGEAIISKQPSELVIEPGRWYSTGLHPCYLKEGNMEEFVMMNKMVGQSQVLAIGETGFDRTTDVDHRAQKVNFQLHSFLANTCQKPLIIHMVKSMDWLFDAMKEMKPRVPWIIHGFRGKPESAKQLLNAGLYLSFGEKYNVEALRVTPLDRLFLETDEATCGIHDIYNKVAEDLEMNVEKLEKQVKNNINRIFFNR